MNTLLLLIAIVLIVFFWGKRGRPIVINIGHVAGDGQIVTDALNLGLPDSMEDFLDELPEEKYIKLGQAVLDAKQASKIMNLFLEEFTIIDDVEVIPL